MLPQIDNSYKSHPFVRPDVVKDKLYWISVVFNPIRYRSRWKLYFDYQQRLIDTGAHFVVVECTFGDREKVIVEENGENHTIIHVQTSTELWIKENLINLAISRLPEDWKYCCWGDADTCVARPDIIGETIQQLQHYDFVQMFSQAADLGSDYEILKMHKGFMWCYKHEEECCWSKKGQYGGDYNGKNYRHPGFLWGATRQAINHVGGLIDWSILGGGDMFMAYALINKLNSRTLPKSLGKAGIKWLLTWQERANQHIKLNVGYIDGLLLHYWHGAKADRRYNDRGQILTNANFDPEKDIKKDWQGLWVLSGNNNLLRDGIRDYLRARNEDQI